jgi:hypothetical protein
LSVTLAFPSESITGGRFTERSPKLQREISHEPRNASASRSAKPLLKVMRIRAFSAAEVLLLAFTFIDLGAIEHFARTHAVLH